MSSLETLSHTYRSLPHGGEVIVLNTGAIITPEAVAMLQALHSRSVGGLRHHLTILKEKGAEKFMRSFYVGYGHKSIGDCGNTTIFIEGVSMLVAKAIQDSMLYSGQEASTRYIDFAKQSFGNPLHQGFLLEEMRSFYVRGLEIVTGDVARRFPQQGGEKDNDYEKAVRARAFDIMRGFLPSGATTNLAWQTNFRQAADSLALLRHHPLAEVRVVASTITDALKEAHPSSFGHKEYSATEDYNAGWMENEYYFQAGMWSIPYPIEPRLAHNGIDISLLQRFGRALQTRPPKTELPKKIASCGTVRFEFQLDFGSFRDIQRHRSVIQQMPLVTMEHGFHPWYLGELPESLKEEAEHFLSDHKKLVSCIDGSLEEKQYYIPMGYKLPNMVTGDLPALVYIVELRATRFVHPTLREQAKIMAQELLNHFSQYGLVIHLDPDPDRFDVRRGTHDIVMV